MTRPCLTVGSLFSGIGGLDLGLERAGMRVVWQAEIDPYCTRVLAKHWPDVPNLGDVTTIDWSDVEPVNLICGGYPCQPFSLAGRRDGERDDRHLWPHMLDAVRVLRPRYALLENVPGHLSMGFGRVLGDLAEIGYDAEWDCIPAAAVGAPHLRWRVFVVAYPQREPCDVRRTELLGGRAHEAEQARLGSCHVADPDGAGLEGHGRPVWRAGELAPATGGAADGTGTLAYADDSGRDRWSGQLGSGWWREPTDCRSQLAHSEGDTRGVGHGDRPTDGNHWAVEPDVGRVAHGVPNRVDRLRGLGNAVVPQVAEHIGRLIGEATR